MSLAQMLQMQREMSSMSTMLDPLVALGRQKSLEDAGDQIMALDSKGGLDEESLWAIIRQNGVDMKDVPLLLDGLLKSGAAVANRQRVAGGRTMQDIGVEREAFGDKSFWKRNPDYAPTQFGWKPRTSPEGFVTGYDAAPLPDDGSGGVAPGLPNRPGLGGFKLGQTREIKKGDDIITEEFLGLQPGGKPAWGPYADAPRSTTETSKTYWDTTLEKPVRLDPNEDIIDPSRLIPMSEYFKRQTEVRKKGDPDAVSKNLMGSINFWAKKLENKGSVGSSEDLINSLLGEGVGGNTFEMLRDKMTDPAALPEEKQAARMITDYMTQLAQNDAKRYGGGQEPQPQPGEPGPAQHDWRPYLPEEWLNSLQGR